MADVRSVRTDDLDASASAQRQYASAVSVPPGLCALTLHVVWLSARIFVRNADSGSVPLARAPPKVNVVGAGHAARALPNPTVPLMPFVRDTSLGAGPGPQ